MKFKADDLIDWGILYGDPPEGGKIISREIVDRRRWVVYEVVFQLAEQVDTDKAYRIYYDSPATEQQDGTEPFGGDDEVEAELVTRTEKTVVVWE